jgi:hypothetical protein
LGAYPQCQTWTANYDRSAPDSTSKVNWSGPLPERVALDAMVLAPGALRTDFVSTAFTNPGLVVSGSARAQLEKLSLGTHRFYPAIIVAGASRLEYEFLLVPPTPWSELGFVSATLESFPLRAQRHVTDLETFKELVRSDQKEGWVPVELELDGAGVADVIRAPGPWRPFGSPACLKAIEETSLTGLRAPDLLPTYPRSKLEGIWSWYEGLDLAWDEVQGAAEDAGKTLPGRPDGLWPLIAAHVDEHADRAWSLLNEAQKSQAREAFDRVWADRTPPPHLDEVLVSVPLWSEQPINVNIALNDVSAKSTEGSARVEELKEKVTKAWPAIQAALCGLLKVEEWTLPLVVEQLQIEASVGSPLWVLVAYVGGRWQDEDFVVTLDGERVCGARVDR